MVTSQFINWGGKHMFPDSSPSCDTYSEDVGPLARQLGPLKIVLEMSEPSQLCNPTL